MDSKQKTRWRVGQKCNYPVGKGADGGKILAIVDGKATLQTASGGTITRRLELLQKA